MAGGAPRREHDRRLSPDGAIGRGVRRTSGDSKYRILVDDPLEIALRRTAIDREERACTGRKLEVSAQDRGPVTGEILTKDTFSRLLCSNTAWLSARRLRTQFVFCPSMATR